MTVFRKCLPSDVSETSPYDWEKERETKKAAYVWNLIITILYLCSGGVDETQERDLGKTSTMAHGEKREPLSAARAETSRNTLKDAKKVGQIDFDTWHFYSWLRICRRQKSMSRRSALCWRLSPQSTNDRKKTTEPRQH